MVKEKVVVCTERSSDGEMLIERLKEEYLVQSVSSVSQVIKLLKKESFELALVYFEYEPDSDYQLSVINQILAVTEDISILIVVSQMNIQSMVRIARTGAFYLWTGQPLDIELVVELIHEKLEIRRLSKVYTSEGNIPFGINGKSPKLMRSLALINKVKDIDANVLVSGETGTGKELVAHGLHFGGKRAKGPFQIVNCGAIPENLIEAELFGYVKGAFTGAYTDRQGKFELADGGTLFLDEIGEIELSLQAKLLRVLEDFTVNPLGSPDSIIVDVRIVAATNRDLEKMVAEGFFREDLFFRLNVVNIDLPPLREREGDIPILAQSFVVKYAQEYSKPVKAITENALKILEEYHYPGNVRELQNCIQRAVIFSEGNYIKVKDLSQNLLKASKGCIAVDKDDFLPICVGDNLAEAEQKLIMATLEYNDNNKLRTAEMLGITDRTLRNKLKSYQMEK